MANEYTKILKDKDSPNPLREYLDKNAKDLLINHGEFFAFYEKLFNIINSNFDELKNYVDKLPEKEKAEKKYRYKVMLNSHLRARTIYMEIIILVKNGFSEGAMARWRTLYELDIITEFILNQKEEVAEEFLKSNKKLKSNWNWAKKSDLFKGKDNVSFSDIRKQCKYDKGKELWKKQYISANNFVHVSSRSIFGHSDIDKKPKGYNLDEVEDIVFAPIYSIDNAAMSLIKITRNAQYLFPDCYEFTIVAKALMKVFGRRYGMRDFNMLYFPDHPESAIAVKALMKAFRKRYYIQDFGKHIEKIANESIFKENK